MIIDKLYARVAEKGHVCVGCMIIVAMLFCPKIKFGVKGLRVAAYSDSNNQVILLSGRMQADYNLKIILPRSDIPDSALGGISRHLCAA